MEVTLGETGALVSEEAGFVLLEKLVQVLLECLPVAARAVAEPDEGGVRAGGRVLSLVIAEPEPASRPEPQAGVRSCKPTYININCC